jgi:hypothetical protein
MSSLSIDLPDDVVAQLRRQVTDRDINGFVTEAVRCHLATADLDRILAEVAEEVGAVPPELEDEAEAAWRAS